MNDGHPTGEVRPVIVRDVLNATERRAQASDRGCGQPPGPPRAVGRLHHAARRCTYFCTYFTVTYFRTLKRPPQLLRPGNPPVT